jgi:hypothetical protein
MNTPTKLGAFALGLVTVFGAAFGAGHLTSPVTVTATNSEHGGHGEGAAAKPAGAVALPGGMLVSDRGYTLNLSPATAGEFAFRITGPDGRAVTAFDVEHDKRMHLIVVRRDLSGFRHVHPQMTADGTWRVASPLGEPGQYRAFADFKPTGGPALVLGVDAPVTGQYAPRPLPAPTATSTVDGYTVKLDGRLQPGRTSRLTLTVSRGGVPVTDLQPYLAAYGHLVALRDGDLAYLHVHPDGEPGDGKTAAGPTITFFAEIPTAGSYRLYLDFQHAGVVRTAEFTVTADTAVPGNAAAPTPSTAASVATSRASLVKRGALEPPADMSSRRPGVQRRPEVSRAAPPAAPSGSNWPSHARASGPAAAPPAGRTRRQVRPEGQTVDRRPPPRRGRSRRRCTPARPGRP